MSFLRYLSPFAAYRDLRFFLAQRRPYQLWFLLLALATTAAILWMFFKDSQFEKPYKPNIIYVESWPITRSDAEIKRQQEIDLAKQKIREAEEARAREKHRQELKQVDSALKQWGL